MPTHATTAWTALLLAAFLLASAACNAVTPEDTEPRPPTFAPIEFHKVGDATRSELQEKRDVGEDAAGWEEKWQLASRYAAGGYDTEALQVLDGALAQSPPPAWADRLRGLRQSLTVRRAEELLLRVEARGLKDYVPFGSAVDFVIRLRNVSDEVIRLLPPEASSAGASSPSALLLQITRHDRDVHAAQLRRTWNQTVFILESGAKVIEIQPGGVHELPVRVPVEAAGGPISGIRTLQVGGTLRPTNLRRGTERRRITLPIRPGRVMALPQGFGPLAADPVRSMRTAIDTVAPAHLLVATEFVPPSRRAQAMVELARALGQGHPALYRAALGAVDLLRERSLGETVGPLAQPLVAALGRRPERDDALMEGLSTLTDVRLAPDARLWQEWYRRDANRNATLQDRASR